MDFLSGIGWFVLLLVVSVVVLVISWKLAENWTTLLIVLVILGTILLPAGLIYLGLITVGKENLIYYLIFLLVFYHCVRIVKSLYVTRSVSRDYIQKFMSWYSTLKSLIFSVLTALVLYILYLLQIRNGILAQLLGSISVAVCYFTLEFTFNKLRPRIYKYLERRNNKASM